MSGTHIGVRGFLALGVVALTLGFPGTEAASPPALVNYQGVLRNAADQPLTGTYGMVFRFFDAPTAGNEILVDTHTAALGGAVTASGGLFSVQLGSGFLTDGSGPGTYVSLANVFRDYGAAYLAVQVGAETLAPRTRVVSAAYASNATNLDGRGASAFLDTSATAQTKQGTLTVGGLTSSGAELGGTFSNTTYTGQASLANGNYGVIGYGSFRAGFFQNTLFPSATAILGTDTQWGVEGYGPVGGGYFKDADSSGHAYVGHGNYGIDARGSTVGGLFLDSDSTGYAYIGYENQGVYAFGSQNGGYFKDSDNSGFAYVGYGDQGIAASGSAEAGYFVNPTSGAEARLAPSLSSFAAAGGELWYGTSLARLAYNDNNTDLHLGVWGQGSTMGGFFLDYDSIGWSNVGYSTYKIYGTGTMAFVQNHPLDDDRVIVYAAPEGDEVATYTRGTARLVDGVARVRLGETFAWVTNPDVGLTAYVTPVGVWTDLYVESKSPVELVVRSRDPQANDVMFDYIVYGLRIGFEEVSIVQEKQQESLIPSMQDHRKRYEDHPELRAFNALERFKAMRASAGETEALDLSAATMLRDAIGEYDPDVHGPVDELFGFHRSVPGVTESRTVAPSHADASEPSRVAPVAQGSIGSARSVEAEGRVDRIVRAAGPAIRVSEPVGPGDVVAVDRLNPGAMRRADIPSDPTVVGIVAVDDELMLAAPDSARLAAAGAIVPCRVDAGYGAIRAGDLLSASPTPGHGMRSVDGQAGTVVAKALEDLETGMTSIRVLVMPR